MTMNDPIADMLTRIRNANTAKHDTVDIPASKMKISIAEILFAEGYITKYEIIEDGNFKVIRITLKYGKDKNEKIITGLKRISKPGLRVYAGKEDIPKVLGGLGIAILSTNQGVVTESYARKLAVGGEVLAYVWQALNTQRGIFELSVKAVPETKWCQAEGAGSMKVERNKPEALSEVFSSLV